MNDFPNKRQHHLSRAQLHNQEERIKRAFRDQIAEIAGLMEVLLSILALVGVFISAIPLTKELIGIRNAEGVWAFDTFLSHALTLVIGIEFIKMLAKHSPGSALEVLLYAIARHMVLGHGTPMENFISVASIAIIFIIRRFWFVPSFGATPPANQASPDVVIREDDPDETFV